MSSERTDLILKKKSEGLTNSRGARDFKAAYSCFGGFIKMRYFEMAKSYSLTKQKYEVYWAKYPALALLNISHWID